MTRIPAPSPSAVSFEEVRLAMHDALAPTAAQKAEKGKEASWEYKGLDPTDRVVLIEHTRY